MTNTMNYSSEKLYSSDVDQYINEILSKVYLVANVFFSFRVMTFCDRKQKIANRFASTIYSVGLLPLSKLFEVVPTSQHTASVVGT